ncbi:hypothetical protein CY34DRAFT_139963 [Suillus luteus UH-Slu-Lm8-n1]|uniref:Uncharacterized protein n=1 Tax=Suillus luteus UH-Slu-Lm8-n1 TaxID=930992 RepID=A0A0D0AL26_9AGAM|nr:hypothetical protein CY34DRAFT_139963 [Suillus luteus UH-Slu-Lm8-n1]
MSSSTLQAVTSLTHISAQKFSYSVVLVKTWLCSQQARQRGYNTTFSRVHICNAKKSSSSSGVSREQEP